MSTVPASSNVMLVGTMVAFFATCLVLTFQAPLIWWLIPAAAAAVVIVLATIRYRKHRRKRAALLGSKL